MYEFDENNEEFTSESAEEVLEQIEDGSEDPEDDSDSVSNRAKERIEEANLWNLLISHTFFTADSAKPEIAEAVSRKVKKYATKQLEILLGMRSVEQDVVVAPAALQFSDEEAQVLRMLIGKVLKRDVPVQPALTKNPEMVQVPAKREPGLNTIGPKPQAKPAQAQKSAAPVKQAAAPSTAPKKKRNPKEKRDYSLPNKNTNVKPMPSADVLLQGGAFTTPKLNITGDGVSGKQMQQSSNLLGQIVNQLTGGGHQIAVDNSKPADIVNESGGDVNERF